MANEYSRAGIKTPKPLKPNVNTNRVSRNKGSSCGKKRDNSLASLGKKKMASVKIRRDRSPALNRRKKRTAAEEHPLVKAFTDSLSQTTSHISKKLPQNLTDKLQIMLSRITATTARSRIYLNTALELKSELFTSSPLLSTGFREQIEGFQELVHDKNNLLGELWIRWEECVNEIENLGVDQGVLKRNGKHVDNSFIDGGDQHGGDMQHSDDAKDNEEFVRLVEDSKEVGRVWIKKMEDSEKKIADEVLQQQKLAATVLL